MKKLNKYTLLNLIGLAFALLSLIDYERYDIMWYIPLSLMLVLGLTLFLRQAWEELDYINSQIWGTEMLDKEVTSVDVPHVGCTGVYPKEKYIKSC